MAHFFAENQGRGPTPTAVLTVMNRDKSTIFEGLFKSGAIALDNARRFYDDDNVLEIKIISHDRLFFITTKERRKDEAFFRFV